MLRNTWICLLFWINESSWQFPWQYTIFDDLNLYIYFLIQVSIVTHNHNYDQVWSMFCLFHSSHTLLMICIDACFDIDILAILVLDMYIYTLFLMFTLRIIIVSTILSSISLFRILLCIFHVLCIPTKYINFCWFV